MAAGAAKSSVFELSTEKLAASVAGYKKPKIVRTSTGSSTTGSDRQPGDVFDRELVAVNNAFDELSEDKKQEIIQQVFMLGRIMPMTRADLNTRRTFATTKGISETAQWKAWEFKAEMFIELIKPLRDAFDKVEVGIRSLRTFGISHFRQHNDVWTAMAVDKIQQVYINMVPEDQLFLLHARLLLEYVNPNIAIIYALNQWRNAKAMIANATFTKKASFREQFQNDDVTHVDEDLEKKIGKKRQLTVVLPYVPYLGQNSRIKIAAAKDKMKGLPIKTFNAYLDKWEVDMKDDKGKVVTTSQLYITLLADIESFAKTYIVSKVDDYPTFNPMKQDRTFAQAINQINSLLTRIRNKQFPTLIVKDRTSRAASSGKKLGYGKLNMAFETIEMDRDEFDKITDKLSDTKAQEKISMWA